MKTKTKLSMETFNRICLDCGLVPNEAKNKEYNNEASYFDLVHPLSEQPIEVAYYEDFIKTSKKDPHNYRIATLVTDDHKSVGMTLHIVGDICLDIWVDFIPKVNGDGTLGFNHSVELCASHWNGDKANIAPRRALRKNMLRMKDFIDAKLNQFAKTLKNADFNSPMYALKNINGGNL